MHIVIVDAFDDEKAEERRQFAAFERSCRAAIAVSGAGDPQIRVVQRKEISKYTYNGDDTAGSTSGLKAFDRVDIFLIAASARLLPWEEASQDLYLLLKMCFFTKKCVFGAGSVAQFLAFLCTGRGIDVHPVNGREGGSLGDLDAHEMAARVVFPRKDVLLDCESGDLFMYQHRRHRWAPFCAVGSKKKSRQRKATRRHQARVTAPSSQVYLSKSDETLCRVVNQHSRHPVFRGLNALDHVVRNRPSWMLDGRALRRAKNRPEILAESALAPLVLQYYNFVAAHFDVSAEYAPAALMLRNYLQHTVRRMQHHGHLDMPTRVYLSFKSQTAKAEERINVPWPQEMAVKSKKKSRSSVSEPGQTKSSTGKFDSMEPLTSPATQARASNPILMSAPSTDGGVSDVHGSRNNTQEAGTGIANGPFADQEGSRDEVALQAANDTERETSPPTMKRTKSNLEMHSRTRAAHPSECGFLAVERSCPVIVRSRLSLEERRAVSHDIKARPQSAAQRRTNYARNAHFLAQHSDRAEDMLRDASAAAQTKRLRKARAARAAAATFPTKAPRPRSAPSHAIRSSTSHERAAALMSQVPPAHLYDRSRHLPLENLLQNALTATHNLRTLEAHTGLAPRRGSLASAATKTKQTRGVSDQQRNNQDAAPRTPHVPRIELGCGPLQGGTINADGPYRSQLDLTRGAYLEEKKKWVSQSQVFNHHVGKASRVEREDAVARAHAPQRDEYDGYRPVSNHCFREPAKDKAAWLPT